jgi:hypothetical protein
VLRRNNTGFPIASIGYAKQCRRRRCFTMTF